MMKIRNCILLLLSHNVFSLSLDSYSTLLKKDAKKDMRKAIREEGMPDIKNSKGKWIWGKNKR